MLCFHAMKKLRAAASAALMLGLAAVSGPSSAASEASPSTNWLTGRLLVATPDMPDMRFAQSVILMVRHNEQGAFGLIINRGVTTMKLDDLTVSLGLSPPGSDREIEVHYGGPVEPRSVFVLHRADWRGPSTIEVTPEISMSLGSDVLEAIADDLGPSEFLFILGYAGWGPNQLESELLMGGWTVSPGSAEFVFDPNDATKWQRAYTLHEEQI
jgi:putative transcriptional regulator